MWCRKNLLSGLAKKKNKIGVEKTCYLLLHYEGWLQIGGVGRLGVFAMCLASRRPAASARLAGSNVKCSAELNKYCFVLKIQRHIY